MTFQQNFNQISIRSYSKGYSAPSTALFNLERAHLKISAKKERINILETVEMPEVIEIKVKLLPLPLPSSESYTATFQFDNKVWPAVPLYPAEEIQFISALQLIYAGSLKIRYQGHKEAILLQGTTIEGMDIYFEENQSLYTFPFDYVKESIYYHVVHKRITIPIWPVGGFYKPGSPLEQIQPVFASLAEQNNKTLIRKTFLSQWHEQGYFPPLPIQQGEQQTVFKTLQTAPYKKFVEAVRKGGIPLCLGDPSEKNNSIQFTYKSLDIVSAGVTEAIIYFGKG